MKELERWTNFYLLMAEAAEAPISLFIVITLAAERRQANLASFCKALGSPYAMPTDWIYASHTFGLC
jgi:hypothetical protein